MKKYTFLLLLFLSNFVFGQDTLQLSQQGEKLRSFYLQQNVQTKWLAGHHINWETGEPDMPEATSGIRTHCSAFVASVCKQSDIYILRPPEHSQILLANAQCDWLDSKDGAQSGWIKIENNVLWEAQKLANEGYIVVACSKNTNRHKPGHIAFIMPTLSTSEKIRENGPLLIQASNINADNVAFRKGFRSHIIDWNEPGLLVSFYYNEHKY